MKNKILTVLLLGSALAVNSASAASIACETIQPYPSQYSMCELTGVNPFADSVSWSSTGNIGVNAGTIFAGVSCFGTAQGTLTANITYANGSTGSASKSIRCEPPRVPGFPFSPF
jgi:hypothetical protein